MCFMLCQFGRTRNVWVATRFILLSSTAESSATSGYVVVREHFGQNEEPAVSNEERTTKKPNFVPKSEFNRCNSFYRLVIMIFFDYFSVFYLILVHFSILSSYGKTFSSFVYVIICCVSAGISTLISISDWSDPYIFRRKMEKTKVCKGRNGGKCVYFPPESAYFLCNYYD